MTFLEIRQRIAELIGMDATDTASDNNASVQDKLKEWVNARYRVIAGKRSWNWLIKDSIIQTSAEITTGTVTATINSTTITFSSAPAVSVANWFIQFSDSDDWYEITSHTAAVATATLANAYLGTTSSTLTYKLRKVYYVLPTDCSKVLNMRQSRDDVSLRYISVRQLDRFIADRTATGEPNYYTIVGVDSSKQARIELYPVPNAAMNINVRYYQTVSEMSADANTPLLPEPFHDILVWDVLATYGYMFLDDTRVSKAGQIRDALYKDMVSNDIDAEHIVRRQPYDTWRTESDTILSRLDLPIEE